MARVIIVLGMHRSGTSVLAGTLQQAGVELGPVSTWNQFNQKGNREHPQVMSLHEQLLADNGGTWDRPPPQVTWRPDHRTQRDRIVTSFAPFDVWGFKDPRTLHTLDGWLEVLPEAKLIGIFRHPVAVARSLAHRNRFSIDQGFALWLEHNRRLLALHQRAPFPVLSFDSTPEELDLRLRAAIGALGLSVPSRLDFFDGALRHMEAADAPLPEAVLDTLTKLQALSR